MKNNIAYKVIFYQKIMEFKIVEIEDNPKILIN